MSDYTFKKGDYLNLSVWHPDLVEAYEWEKNKPSILEYFRK